MTQYDIELWLRIEGALGKKLKEHEHVKEEVMVFADRVGEAQRSAAQEMKQLHEQRGKKGATLKGRRTGGGPKRIRDDMDREER